MVEFGKMLSLLVGVLATLLAVAVLVWIMQFQFALLLPDLFNIADPFGLLVIFALLVFGGFYLLHAGFETIYSVFRG